MNIKDVSCGIEVPAAGSIYQAAGVVTLCPLRNFNGFKLAPGFVEGHPTYNTWMGDQHVHDLFPFLPKI